MDSFSNFEQLIAGRGVNAVYISTALLIVLAVVSLLIKKPDLKLKIGLFLAIAIVTIFCTLYLASLTIYLNNISVSKGPVHYHADFEIWSCGKEYELVDPTGWSNKVGTATLHEHNDKRIHLEGVVVEQKDSSLGKFFNVVGGRITADELAFPSTAGPVDFKTGDKCPDGIPAALQVFAFKVFGKTAVQTKVANPSEYTISPQSNIPPGDCIIIEFDKVKDTTDHLCRSFQVAKEIGKLTK